VRIGDCDAGHILSGSTGRKKNEVHEDVGGRGELGDLVETSLRCDVALDLMLIHTAPTCYHWAAGGITRINPATAVCSSSAMHWIS
jgi:hypothetical protein